MRCISLSKQSPLLFMNHHYRNRGVCRVPGALGKPWITLGKQHSTKFSRQMRLCRVSFIAHSANRFAVWQTIFEKIIKKTKSCRSNSAAGDGLPMRRRPPPGLRHQGRAAAEAGLPTRRRQGRPARAPAVAPCRRPVRRCSSCTGPPRRRRPPAPLSSRHYGYRAGLQRHRQPYRV